MKQLLSGLQLADGASPTEYIGHHLGHWTVGEGFWSFNLDTILVSIVSGIIFMALFYAVSRKVTSGVPGKLQSFIEMCYDFIDGQVKDAFNGPTKFLPPLALTIFVWIVIMNAMDFIPVDLAAGIAKLFGNGEFVYCTFPCRGYSWKDCFINSEFLA